MRAAGPPSALERERGEDRGQDEEQHERQHHAHGVVGVGVEEGLLAHVLVWQEGATTYRDEQGDELERAQDDPREEEQEESR